MFHSTQSVEGQTVTLHLSGRFDFQSRNDFQAAVAHAQSTNPREIILNFTEVPFLDSSALGMLMIVKRDWPDPTCQLSLAASPGYVMDVLNLASMDKYFSINELPALATHPSSH